ncbi:RidA family protein (plasmid) [Chryseobacterium sp. SNU WT5]|uniref:RidA family protein n=1 Tax=Chryseobacterium sp. SNU WT5 TaxID=2594269 RepID=UPI00117E7F16|nr:RidA family protein [Chryseobacterium sp. SNU WT5]QDP86719.1 RidA family protein [Chryseobacterium sp. SNU WT5]
MQKNTINPWSWQDSRSYVQAVEVKDVNSTLYISGQTAISDEGISSEQDMRSQLVLTIQNLEKVIRVANYELKNIVRLNIYTTSNAELFANFDILQEWIKANGIKQTSTVLEVKSLFETLKVELEATVVR